MGSLVSLGQPIKALPDEVQDRLPPCTHRLFPCSCSHFSAFLGASPTGLGTPPTMFIVILMFLAFFGTGVTNCSADVTHLCTELRIPTHKGRTSPAKFCTIDAQPGAFGQVTQALIRATFTLLSTCCALVHTGLMLMGHREILHPWMLHIF